MEPKEQLRKELDRLKRRRGVSTSQRGYELESLIIRVASSEGIECGASYRAKGEQIDGLLELDSRYLLLEARWTPEPLPASEIYAFRAKVEGKLVGTVGVFIAVNGFAETVPDVLRFGKQINVILVDGDDLTLALKDEYSFKRMLQVKLRRAAQHGEVWYAYRRHLDEAGA